MKILAQRCGYYLLNILVHSNILAGLCIVRGVHRTASQKNASVPWSANQSQTSWPRSAVQFLLLWKNVGFWHSQSSGWWSWRCSANVWGHFSRFVGGFGLHVQLRRGFWFFHLCECFLAHIFSGVRDSWCHDQVHLAWARQQYEEDYWWCRSARTHWMPFVQMPQLY